MGILLDAFLNDQLDDLQLIVDGHKARVIDGWAAGEPYFRIEFLEGPWQGLAPWFDDDLGDNENFDNYLQYQENINSDGFGFNWNLKDDDTVEIVEGHLLPIPSGTYLILEVGNG